MDIIERAYAKWMNTRGVLTQTKGMRLRDMKAGFEAGYLAGQAAEREVCAKIAENEMVDAQSTGSEADHAYNAAIQDVVNAIRARGEA